MMWMCRLCHLCERGGEMLAEEGTSGNLHTRAGLDGSREGLQTEGRGLE